MTSAIPVVLVSGFLGAGKTTLMRRVILDCGARGIKAALIVNEFGTADVDSNILREADAELLASVSGGCACCSGQDDFLYAMMEIGKREGAARPDVILVESSGLADPVLMLDALTIAGLLPLVRVASLIAVVDGPRLLQTTELAVPLLLRQIKLADLIVLNKIDLPFGNVSLEDVREFLRGANAHARIEDAKECQISFAPLWQRVLHDAAQVERGDAGEAAPHAHFQTLALPVSPLERAQLEESLGTLGPEVWRAKGFVQLKNEEGLFLVQYAGGPSPQWELAPFRLPPSLAKKPQPQMVFIGPALNRAALQARFGGGLSLL
jgi:G3E family GTPase